MTNTDDVMRSYNNAPPFIQAKVRSILGMTDRTTSPDPGKPWGNVGPVSPDKAEAAQDALDAIASNARGMGQ